jgi:uncharacterized protein
MGPESLIRRLGVFARCHVWDGSFVLLFAAALLVGGNAVLAGADAFAQSLLPTMPAEASDQPSRVAEGVARLPMFAFAGPAHYGPAVLFPITGHSLPDWLRSRGLLAKPAAIRDPVIAICIDDLGEDLAGTDRAMALPKEVALSFLPYAEATPFLAQEAEGKGHDVLAHVPMEALSHTDPGPMTLETGAPDIAVRAEWNIARVPGLIGINNHEGSRFTEDAASLAPVAQLLAARHLFFFDSRTGPDTKVMAVSRNYGVASGERDVFLDDTITEDAVRQQLDALAAVAKRRGAAIAIGHPHDATLKVLAAWLAENHGVTLVRLPEAMQRKSQAETLVSR